jgi:twitching motility protein PilT
VAAPKTTVARLVRSEWNDERERDTLLAELIGTPLAPGEALQLARHTDPEVAAAGTRLFAARADAKAVRELIRALPDVPPADRGRLTQALRTAPVELVKAEIDEMLRSREPTVRRLGWDSAIQLPAAARQPYLHKAVVAAPPAMRLKALNLILDEREAADVRTLLIKLTQASDPRLAMRALQALSAVRGDEVLELMLARFAATEPQARAIASDYLKREAEAAPELVRQAMLQGLTHRDRAVRKAASEVLFASGAPDVVVGEALEFCSGLLGWLRNRVLEGLGDGGEPVLQATLTLLRHPDENTRFHALTLADSFHDKRLAAPFCDLLQDPDWWIRVTVCDSLARLGDGSAVPRLVSVLGDDEIRWAAIDALGRLGTPEAVQALIGLLQDPREQVRLEVIPGLGRLKDQRLLPVLKHVRDTDSNLSVRRRANDIIEDLVAALGLDEAEAGVLRVEQTFELPLQQLLHEAREAGASDLHLFAGEPPRRRVDGELLSAGGAELLNAAQVKDLILSLLDESQQQEMLKQGQLDFSYDLEGEGRYRGNAFLGRKGWNAAYRMIPTAAPRMSKLGLPKPLYDLDSYSQGIVTFCGPTGSGKSASLASVVNRLNERRSIHIITLEDPIEFVHPSKRALVNQRQVKVHTKDIVRGLRAALREDPDVLVLGELREPRAIRLALEAAATGHLVLTTMHTASVTQAIERLVSSFSPEEQDHARSALAETLKFVVCQRLLPKARPPGRVGVFELLKITPSIGNLIRKAETHQIPGLMQLGSALGNRTLDQALMEKVEAGIVRAEDAWHHAAKRAAFEPYCDAAWLADQGLEEA